MDQALIGHSGFVGGNLSRQRHFSSLYNSSNIETMAGRTFDRIVCAGLPAAKWIANRDPETDLSVVRRLMKVVETVSTPDFILISTVDVYPVTVGADETTNCHGMQNHAYGTHRLLFEDFIRARFPEALIVRLPALFGPGLKKNIIFDLVHNRELAVINPHSSFQWYDMGRLADDIECARGNGITLVNFVTEPIKTAEILDRFFPDRAVGQNPSPIAQYNLKTVHGPVWGGTDGYMIDADQVLAALGRYIATQTSPS